MKRTSETIREDAANRLDRLDAMSKDQERQIYELKEKLADADHVKTDLFVKLDNRNARISELEERLEHGRQRMPAERASTTHKIELTTRDGVVDIYVIIGFYEDGRPGEIFVRCSTMGSTVSGFVDAWSIGVSMLLQMGMPIADIIKKFSHVQFEPFGYAKSGDHGFQASSILDAIVRFLEMRYQEEPDA